jgi:hypothetical protein
MTTETETLNSEYREKAAPPLLFQTGSILEAAKLSKIRAVQAT